MPLYALPKLQKESKKDPHLQHPYLSPDEPEQSKNRSSTTDGYPVNEVRKTTTLMECAKLMEKISCIYLPLKPSDILY